MYNDSKIFRSKIREAFANILKLSNGVPQNIFDPTNIVNSRRRI